MIKILHFITDSNIGGAGNLLCQQIKGIDKRKFSITVALPKKSALIGKLKHLPCKIIECRYGADKSFSLESITESYGLIKALRPDIVHSHGSLSSRIAATALNIPCRVFTRHCAPPVSKMMKNPLIRYTNGGINNLLSTAIVAVSVSAKQNLCDMGCSSHKITTVINGASPLRILSDSEKEYLRIKYGLSTENFVISYFARLEEEKGHKTLLRAAQICKKYYPNFRFFIVGTGSFEAKLKNYTSKMGISDTVHFVGFCEDVAPFFNITDVNVNCSYVSETASLSLSEGMSLGIPAIASDIGGNPYMVKNCENGLIFPARNADALAMAIIRLYRDKKLYKKCSLGAYKRYQDELNDRIMCQRMNSFYLREYRRTKNKNRMEKIRLTDSQYISK